MKTAHRTVIEGANTALFVDGNLAAVEHFFSPEYTLHLTGRVLHGGHKVVQGIVAELNKSFPDMKIDIDILLEKDSQVAWQRTFRATHKGKFKSFDASQRKIEWRDMVVSRISRNKIVEEWVVTDLAEQLLLFRK